MDSAAWSAGDDPVVGVVDLDTGGDGESEGDDRASSGGADSGSGIDSAFDAALAARDVAPTIERGDLDAVLAADPSLLVARGESSLSAVARARSDVPVLPVGDVPGIAAADAERAPDALAAVLEGDARERSRPVLEIDVDDGGTVERALFDATLVADEPARISEYAVRSRGDAVASFRADGVVVATPAGSYGYTSAIDGPRLSAAVDAVAVTPIAPFVTQTRRWVLPDDEVTLTVERDEGDVRVVADDRSVDTIAFGDRVTVSVVDTLSTLVVPDAALES